MRELTALLNRYNEGDKLTNLETLVVIARDEIAAEELAAMKEERNKIAKYIRVTLDDGTAPDNLADHVLYVMIQEYDPMVQRIQRLESELAKVQAERDALKEASRDFLYSLPEEEILLAREVWGNTNTRIVLEKRNQLAIALKGDE